MWDRIVLEKLVGKELSFDHAYAFALGQRLGRRCHYGGTRLKVMKWVAGEEWAMLREWLLQDLPNEERLPSIKDRRLQEADRREAMAMVLSASWHALRSYESGNSSTELATEVCEAIERTAKILDLVLDGVKR